MNLDPITLPLSIPPQALVLEVGSGHNPHPRSDVLLEKYFTQDKERSGNMVADRPTVEADAEKMPFKPNSFDYIICRHVVEHMETPENFFQEAMRIGHAGYIETPSMFWELLQPVREYHRWILLEIDNQIVMRPRPEQYQHLPLGYLFPTFNKNSAAYRLWARQHADLLYVRYLWQNEICYEVNPTDPDLLAWFEQPWSREQALQYIPPKSTSQQALSLLGGALQSVLRATVARFYKPHYRSHHSQFDLAELMQCPDCQHQIITIEGGLAHCSQCNWQTQVILP